MSVGNAASFSIFVIPYLSLQILFSISQSHPKLKKKKTLLLKCCLDYLSTNTCVRYLRWFSVLTVLDKHEYTVKFHSLPMLRSPSHTHGTDLRNPVSLLRNCQSLHPLCAWTQTDRVWVVVAHSHTGVGGAHLSHESTPSVQEAGMWGHASPPSPR